MHRPNEWQRYGEEYAMKTIQPTIWCFLYAFWCCMHTIFCSLCFFVDFFFSLSLSFGDSFCCFFSCLYVGQHILLFDDAIRWSPMSFYVTRQNNYVCISYASLQESSFAWAYNFYTLFMRCAPYAHLQYVDTGEKKIQSVKLLRCVALLVSTEASVIISHFEPKGNSVIHCRTNMQT